MSEASTTGSTRSGGAILVGALKAQGADTIFGVPGESALPIFDALVGEDVIRFVTCRHEASACHMAEADGKLTGRPGVCLVSRGPGAMHAAIGVHTAMQDSTPLVLLIGQVPRDQSGREGFQEMDYVRHFADTAKWAAEIDRTEAIPEYISRAFHVATQGRPGPVVLSIPEDILATASEVADPPRFQHATPYPAPDNIVKLRALLQGAERPLVIVGSGGWTAEARGILRDFVSANDLPLVAGFRSQDILDNRSPNYAGDLSLGSNPEVAKLVQRADLLLVIGDRLSEVTTKRYTLLDSPRPRQVLIHVHPGSEELGKTFRADLPIQANSSAFMKALSGMAPMAAPAWAGWRQEARRIYETYVAPPASGLPLDLARVVAHVRDVLPDDAIVTNGAGNYTIWLHRFFQYRDLGTQLAPKSGAMGYGLPAAIAAKLRFPSRQVVAFAGDGCFLMASPDFATAVRNELAIVVIIVNNGLYGSIRMHQERHFPGRPSGTDLTNPDFAALARSYGAFGEIVEDGAAFPAALQRAMESGGPAILELRVDHDQLTPGMRLRKAGVRPHSEAHSR
ncbi:thiamine pyrophosphate protein [Agaricicola taiwanensis]|uniref:Thiamine pyrophosphate protein n=2 Tax=Agaricicola taiwanensis TaxID=591372 RepID=A0A8J2YEF5_9RHOB|nr:thiamine pyrophosphate protein [Agaricicola taiwanensis]